MKSEDIDYTISTALNRLRVQDQDNKDTTPVSSGDQDTGLKGDPKDTESNKN